VNCQRTDSKLLALVGSILLIGALHGCSTAAVGAPCLPEQVPEDGFNELEAYIESSSVQCQTRVCMVYKLAGDPRCVPGQEKKDAMGNVIPCSDPTQAQQRVYCTCRCKAPANTNFADCSCPDGFSCTDVLDQGDPGVRGSYCVKNGTFNTAK
jgi:hypothetical protein